MKKMLRSSTRSSTGRERAVVPSVFEPGAAAGTSVAEQGPRWRSTQFLALASVPLITYQMWTLISWLMDDPHQIDQYREPGVTMVAARVLEVISTVATVALVGWLVRRCRRERRITFDAMLLAGLIATVFWDTIIVINAPVWLYSSNWLNVNDWWGHAPMASNRAGGTMPMPVVFQFGAYGALTFGLIVGVNSLMARVQVRRPSMSAAQLVIGTWLFLFALCVPLTLVFESLHLWSGADLPWTMFSGSDWRLSAGEPAYGASWLTAMCALRFFTDRHGKTLTERGLDHLSSGRRSLVSFMATIAYCNLAVIILSLILLALANGWLLPYPPHPGHLVSGICDVEGWNLSTAYGACPGAN